MDVTNLINENLELIKNLQEKLIELKVAQSSQGKKDCFIEPPIGAPIKGRSATFLVCDDIIESKEETTKPIEMPITNSDSSQSVSDNYDLIDSTEAARILGLLYSTFMANQARNTFDLHPVKYGTKGNSYLFRKTDIYRLKESLPPLIEQKEGFIGLSNLSRLLGCSSGTLRINLMKGRINLKEYRCGLLPMFSREDVKNYLDLIKKDKKRVSEDKPPKKKKTHKDLVSKVPDSFALENKPDEMRINLMYSDFDYLNMTEASKYLGIHATKLWWWTTKPNPPLFNSRNERGQVQYLFSDLKKYKEENVKK